MKTITQSEIANALGVSVAFINQLVTTKKRPSWNRAKQLAKITKTKPELWLDGSADEIRKAIGA
jgi:plasmid maintenance system antidote protein VapI